MKLPNIVKNAAGVLRHGKRITIITTVFSCLSFNSFAQCNLSELDISTGRNAMGGAPIAVPFGANDPQWIITNITSDITALVTGLPPTPYPAVSANPATTSWALPLPNTNWISFYNPPAGGFGWYSPIAPGPYAVTVRRYFRLCADEKLAISLNGGRDNYISNINIDGGGPIFSEPPTIAMTNYSILGPIVNIVTGVMPVGSHYIEITFHNSSLGISSPNPHALYINGFINTLSGTARIVADHCNACN